MKQTLMTAAIVIGTMNAAIAQSVWYSYGVSTGKYDKYTDKWYYSDIEPISLKFTMQGKVIMVNDEAKSVYTTGEKINYKSEPGWTKHGWWSKDEKNRSCIIQIIMQDSVGSVRIIIVYDETCFVYYMKMK